MTITNNTISSASCRLFTLAAAFLLSVGSHADDRFTTVQGTSLVTTQKTDGFTTAKGDPGFTVWQNLKTHRAFSASYFYNADAGLYLSPGGGNGNLVAATQIPAPLCARKEHEADGFQYFRITTPAITSHDFTSPFSLMWMSNVSDLGEADYGRLVDGNADGHQNRLAYVVKADGTGWNSQFPTTGLYWTADEQALDNTALVKSYNMYFRMTEPDAASGNFYFDVYLGAGNFREDTDGWYRIGVADEGLAHPLSTGSGDTELGKFTSKPSIARQIKLTPVSAWSATLKGYTWQDHMPIIMRRGYRRTYRQSSFSNPADITWKLTNPSGSAALAVAYTNTKSNGSDKTGQSTLASYEKDIADKLYEPYCGWNIFDENTYKFRPARTTVSDDEGGAARNLNQWATAYMVQATPGQFITAFQNIGINFPGWYKVTFRGMSNVNTSGVTSNRPMAYLHYAINDDEMHVGTNMELAMLPQQKEAWLGGASVTRDGVEIKGKHMAAAALRASDDYLITQYVYVPYDAFYKASADMSHYVYTYDDATGVTRNWTEMQGSNDPVTTNPEGRIAKLHIAITVNNPEGSGVPNALAVFNDVKLEYCGNSEGLLHSGLSSEDYLKQQVQLAEKPYATAAMVGDRATSHADQVQHVQERRFYLSKSSVVADEWNAVTLPVSITRREVLKAFGADTRVAEIYSDEPTAYVRASEGWTNYFVQFKTVTVEQDDDILIEAGKHYLIKPAGELNAADEFLSNSESSYNKRTTEQRRFYVFNPNRFELSPLTSAVRGDDNGEWVELAGDSYWLIDRAFVQPLIFARYTADASLNKTYEDSRYKAGIARRFSDKLTTVGTMTAKSGAMPGNSIFLQQTGGSDGNVWRYFTGNKSTDISNNVGSNKANMLGLRFWLEYAYNADGTTTEGPMGSWFNIASAQSGGSAKMMYSIDGFLDETTAIHGQSASTVAASSAIYTVSGQQVRSAHDAAIQGTAGLPAGLYIMNGKKVAVW